MRSGISQECNRFQISSGIFGIFNKIFVFNLVILIKDQVHFHARLPTKSTRVNTSPKQVNMNHHEPIQVNTNSYNSTQVQHESAQFLHDSAQVWYESTGENWANSTFSH